MSKNMEKFDIQVAISILAEDEKDAEHKTMLFLKNATVVTGNPDIIDWELIEFIPEDLRKSCGC